MDAAHGKIYKGDGIRRRCAGTGQAGWFFRVLTPGTLSVGDVLRLRQRPHPTWTLWAISDLLFSTNTDYPYDPRAQNWTAAKLDKIKAAFNLKELGEYQWRSWAAELIDIAAADGDDTAARPKKAKTAAARERTGKPTIKKTASGRAGKAAGSTRSKRGRT